MSVALRVALAQSGDRRALDLLLRDHQAPLYRHACTIVSDPDLALDALQASLLLIARRLGTVRDPRWFRAWAYRITTRESLRVARRLGRDRRMFNDEIPVDTLAIAVPPRRRPTWWPFGQSGWRSCRQRHRLCCGSTFWRI